MGVTGKSTRRVFGLVSRMLPATLANRRSLADLILTIRVIRDMADATSAVPGSITNRGPLASFP
jgi:hypothetical protein